MKANTSRSENNISGVGKKTIMSWISFRSLRRKNNSECSLDDNYEKSQLAERIVQWQQKSSREEISTNGPCRVDRTQTIAKTQTADIPEIYFGQSHESTCENSPEKPVQNCAPTVTSSDDSPLHTTEPSRTKQWHEDLVPPAINKGLHTLWEEGTKNLPPWPSFDCGVASTNSGLNLTFPSCMAREDDSWLPAHMAD
jgi:hypothetical protein